MDPKRGRIVFLIAILIILGIATLAILWINSEGSIQTNIDQVIFLLLNGMLFLYLSWKISFLARKEKWLVLLSPVVLSSIYHFMGSYLLPNLRHTQYIEWQYVNGYFLLSPEPYKWMNLAMLGVLVAAFGMWQGYQRNIACLVAAHIRGFLLSRRLLKHGRDINLGVIFVLLIFTVVAFLLNVKLGVFGYSSEAGSLAQTSSIRAFIKLGTDCGPLVLLVLSMVVFSKHYRGNAMILLLFVVVFFMQILLGFLSGFKSQVVMPVIITGFGYYVANHRLPLKLILFSFVMLMAAYQVIEPFRQMRYSSNTFDSRSVNSIANTMVTAATNDTLQEKHAFRWENFVARQDMLTFTAVSMAYINKRGVPGDSPAFKTNILISPFLAFIPRFIWRDKPMANDGHWYNVVVLGAHPSTQTAVGMGPVSYCYFGGGFLMILVVFWIIGLLQRVIFEVFVDESLGGWIVYLILLPGFVTIPSNIGFMLTGFFRVVPFAILVQYLLILNKNKHINFTSLHQAAL